MARHHHILNASSNLLGISLLIITGLHLAGLAERTMGDDVASLAAICFAVSCIFSYFAIRREPESSKLEDLADKIFLGGLVFLLTGVLLLGFSKL
jgi:uncharacterized membrane protein YkgB